MENDTQAATEDTDAPVTTEVPASTEPTGLTPEAAAAAAAAAVAEARKRAPAANFLPIVRGRLPLIFVHAIRFDAVLKVMGNKDLAVKFGTSIGKVFDIKKGRNFAYVTEDFKPTAEDVAQAEAWMAQVGAQNAKGLNALGDKTVMQTTLDAYKAKGLATPAEAAAFAAQKGATKAPRAASTPTAAAPSAAAGVASQGVSASNAGAADDLLS